MTTSTSSGITTRRGFMKIMGVAGGGLAVGFLVEGCAHVKGGQALGGAFHPNAWVHVESDGTIKFLCDRAEMGQGIVTSHVQMLAEELEVSPLEITPVFAPADYDAYGVQLTGGSSSTTSQFDVIRKAGATARELLKKSAARKWGVEVTEVKAQGAHVHHAVHGKLHYKELAAGAAEESISESDIVLKEAKDWHTIGTPMRRLDSAAKVNGSAVFGIDVQVPGMLTAVVVRSPILRGSVKSFDATKAKQVRGVKHVVQIPQGVAVVADSYWQARKAANALDIVWNPGPMAGFSTAQLRDTHLAMLKEEGNTVTESGDVEEALAGATKTIKSVYEVPFLHHATMEPMNATAFVEADRCRIWAPTQSPTVTKEVAARLTGFSHSQIEVVTTFMGGGFGRRGLADFVSEAIEISMRTHEPVKVVWSREDDMHNGQLRPAALSFIEGGVGPDGMPVAWHHRMTGQSLLAAFADLVGAMAPEMVPRPLMDFVGAGLKSMVLNGHLVDPTAVEGASDQPYAIPNAKVEIALHETGVPVFPWRSVGHSINGFIVESFIDELANLGGKDPVELRRTLLTEEPRQKAVLDAAAKGIGWGSPPPAGRFRGIAQHACFGSFCAHAVEISVNTGKLRVHRVVSAIDCGRAINPDLVAAQMESGVIYGLSAALKQRIDFDGGHVRQSNFHDYPLLRMADAPVIDTVIIPSEERPSGVGELGVPPLAAALGNAFFAATGVRLRRMPMQQDIDLVLAGKKPNEVTL